MERNTITVALPRVTEITRVSVTIMAKGQALLLSHNMKIISAHLIFLSLHKVGLCLRNMSGYLSPDSILILINKRQKLPRMSLLYLAQFSNWHLQGNMAESQRHGERSNDVRTMIERLISH